MKLVDIMLEQEMTFARRVEDFINQNFYVFDDKVSSDDSIDYIIEKSKAKYRISAWGINGVSVTADIGTGATSARARSIKRRLMKLAVPSESI
jgi:hypothetical protein